MMCSVAIWTAVVLFANAQQWFLSLLMKFAPALELRADLIHLRRYWPRYLFLHTDILNSSAPDSVYSATQAATANSYRWLWTLLGRWCCTRRAGLEYAGHRTWGLPSFSASALLLVLSFPCWFSRPGELASIRIQGHIYLVGTVVILVGIACRTPAGFLRETEHQNALSQDGGFIKGSFYAGMVVVTASGLLSSALNLC